MRARMSAAPPGANVLTMRTGREGHSSAEAGVAAANVAANAREASERRVLLFEPLKWVHRGPASSVCSLSQPKSDLSDFGRLRVPNSGKPEFGWERGGVRGFALSTS